jgi:hypothetical protein
VWPGRAIGAGGGVEALEMKVREVIFCVNSGRVGSKHLAALIDTSREAHGLHEAEPAMNGPFLRMVESAPESATFEQRLIKIRAIEEWMERHATKPVYCDTNHLFIVTFHDVAVASFPRMRVLFLRRALPLVVKSFVELGYYTDRNADSAEWHISPSAVTAAAPLIAPFAELDPIDRVIAHLVDIEARGERFRAANPQIPTVDVRIEQLGTEEDVERLFGALGLTTTDETSVAIGRRGIHKMKKWKSQIGISISLDECRQRIDRYVELASQRGIELPATLALE